jgi:hypothetical protein
MSVVALVIAPSIAVDKTDGKADLIQPQEKVIQMEEKSPAQAAIYYYQDF